jgi:signal transduction histidine kinase
MEARSALGRLPASWPSPRRAFGSAPAATAAVLAVTAFAAATALGAPAPVLSAVFTLTVPLVPVGGWLALRRAPPDLRRLLEPLFVAAILWAGGSLLWYAVYVRDHHVVPRAGPWLVPFSLAYALSVLGLCRVLEQTVSLARAALDVSVVVAAGIAFAAALAGQSLRDGVDGQSLATAVDVFGGVAVLVLVTSAAFGNWQGLRRSVVLFGVGQICITCGHVVYSYEALEKPTAALRWPELGWFCGAILMLFAAFVIATGRDRPVRPARGDDRPDRATAMMYVVFGALAVTIAVAVYGHASGQPSVLGVGLATSAWLVAATTVRAGAALRDVRRARDELAAANERLFELDRMKDQLLSAVSHDMRTPLLSISGFSELLHDSERSEEGRRFVAAIDRNARRMLHMVDDLMLAARLRGGGLEVELSPTDVARVARDCVDSLAPIARTRSIDLSLTAADVPLVAGDARRLEQALDNVVSNALKFTPAGGEVAVRVSRVDGMVAVDVADSGIGIPADECGHVFDAFYRSSRDAVRTQPGIGLGLHLVEAIVAAHGGSVSIDSEEGRGTLVRLTLPLSQPGR